MPSKLWVIRQDSRQGYDTYDSAVVAAPDEEAARRVHPESEEGPDHPDTLELWARLSPYGSWCLRPEDVTVEYLGHSERNLPDGVIIASFNAG